MKTQTLMLMLWCVLVAMGFGALSQLIACERGYAVKSVHTTNECDDSEEEGVDSVTEALRARLVASDDGKNIKL